MPPSSVAEPEVFPFVALPILVTLALAWGTVVAWRRAGHAPTARRAGALAGLGAGTWMAVTHAIAVSPLGARLSRLPLWALVGVQAFRGPLEVAVHRLGPARDHARAMS